MWINERGDGIKTCLDCGRKYRLDCGTYGSGYPYCEVHGVDGFDKKRERVDLLTTCEMTDVDVRARLGRDDVRAVTRLKASINEATKAMGLKPVSTHRYDSGLWIAAVQDSDAGSSWAQAERPTEVEALGALAVLLGVVLR